MPENFETFNELNLKIWNVFNLIKTNQINGFFEFAFNAYFGQIDKEKAKYICNTFAILENITSEYQEKQALKRNYEQKAKAAIK